MCAAFVQILLTAALSRFTLFTMEETRDRILACACEIYLEDGFEGFSMRRLARAVGVTAPALYRHYESKESVLGAVVGEGHKVLGQYLYRTLAGPTPQERMHRAGEAFLDFALDHPRYFQMMYAFTEFLGLEEMPEELREETCAISRFWDDRVRESIEAGLLRDDDPKGISLALWAHGYGLISLYLRGLLELDEDSFRAVYDDAFRRLFVGIASDAVVTEARATSLRETRGFVSS